MDLKDIYKPKIIDTFLIDGVAAETIPSDQTGKILRKAFISSLDETFPLIATNIFSLLLGMDPSASLNSLLVIIKPDNKAYIYSKYPFGTQVVVKRPVKAHSAVSKRDIADITGVFFKDDVIDLNPHDGDKIIWLFRENWSFGLFFDLSGKLNSEKTLKELGYYYRFLLYLSEYLFLERGSNFEQMIKDGWFPFVALIGDGMDKIRLYYKEGKRHPWIINDLINSFDKQRIESLTSIWWSNFLFEQKKKIIQAGINSYLSGCDEGYVNAVKNLSSELEGIIRIAYHLDHGKKPTTKDMKEYITKNGTARFNSPGSLCFPNKFLDYLNDFIFKGFDVEADDIPESRHSVAHGVANCGVYNKEFAFKLILTLDNIYFFSGKQ